jgi:hypothetical protein
MLLTGSQHALRPVIFSCSLGTRFHARRRSHSHETARRLVCELPALQQVNFDFTAGNQQAIRL